MISKNPLRKIGGRLDMAFAEEVGEVTVWEPRLTKLKKTDL